MVFKKRVIKGVKWSAVSMVIGTILQLITISVLARLLRPTDFGLMGMLMVVIVFGQTFIDIGMSNALIQKQNVPENHLSSFFWLNLVFGLVIFIIIVLTRSLVADFFKQNISRYLLIVSVTFLITPLGQLFTTLVKKELYFNLLARVGITSVFSYAVSTIGFAYMKMGIWSLIFGQIVRAITYVIILFTIFKDKWLPKLHFNIQDIKPYFHFGLFLTGRRILNTFSRRIDTIIIGRILGPTHLGFYTFAYQLKIFPVSKMNMVITRVAFPAFSIIQNDNNRMRQGLCKSIKYISTITFPLLMGIFTLSSEFVTVVYGPKWEPSIVILQIFCFMGLFISAGNIVGPMLLAKGRADITFYLNLIKIVLASFVILIGIRWGIKGVAYLLLFLHILLFFFFQGIVNRLIDLDFRNYFKSFRTSLICTTIMVLAIFILKSILKNIHTLFLIVIAILLGIFVYTLFTYKLDKGIFKEIRAIMYRD